MYGALLADPDSSETDLQRFIEENLWLLGLEVCEGPAATPDHQGSRRLHLEARRWLS